MATKPILALPYPLNPREGTDAVSPATRKLTPEDAKLVAIELKALMAEDKKGFKLERYAALILAVATSAGTVIFTFGQQASRLNEVESQLHAVSSTMLRTDAAETQFSDLNQQIKEIKESQKALADEFHAYQMRQVEHGKQ